MTVRDDQKLQIQQATDIVRLVGEDLALKPKGREFVCLCPFHDDRRPSMTVVPAKQIFHCFVCGAGGDAFGWLMKYHKMTFPEALRHLADRAGIKLEQRAGPRDQGSAQQEQTDRELIKAANQRALGFFQAMLRHADHGRGAREYLKHRGISGEMVEAFQLGYAPDRWDGLVTTIRDKSWNRRSFELAGLISARPTGQGHYDKLRHRLIFPICDSIGRPIAFGGRVLPGGTLEDKNEAKYLNTAETPLFNKSATLYGLHLAKSAPGGIIGGKTAVIVEGYTDVIAAHQAGARDVVATLGTALTSRHVTELRRYAEKVVLVFDADEAGQKAADRAVEVFLAGALDVAIAVLPDGRDPAELLATENGRQRWQDVIDIAADALTYQFERVRRQMEAATTVTGRQRLVEEYLRKLAGLGLARMGIIRRSLVIQRLAELLHLPEANLVGLLKRLAPAAGRTPPGGPAPSSAEPPPQGADN
ncbi:MAG: DNA primase, partial [Phycisphaeraceae bacterium]